MKKRIKAVFLGLYFVAIILATVQRAQATLGESAISVESDRKAFAAVQNITQTRKGYTVQELNSEANNVREFISSTGVVFAVAWNGQSHPDLTSLLGTYVGEYQQALRQNPRHFGKRHFQVKTDRIIVEKWGHMRNMQGRAYIPALVPPGVNINEIK
jgi:Protein of unknown function (DUF2844)